MQMAPRTAQSLRPDDQICGTKNARTQQYTGLTCTVHKCKCALCTVHCAHLHFHVNVSAPPEFLPLHRPREAGTGRGCRGIRRGRSGGCTCASPCSGAGDCGLPACGAGSRSEPPRPSRAAAPTPRTSRRTLSSSASRPATETPLPPNPVNIDTVKFM